MKRLRVRQTKAGLAYYFDHGGKPRRWEYLGTDEAVAMRRYERLMEKPPAGTVDAMLAECIEAQRSKVALGTFRNYQSYRKHLSAVWGLCAPDDAEELNQAAVRRYLKTCPRMTFRNEISLLSMAYENWMDQGRLDFNPCYGVKVKRKGSRRTRLLTWTEIDQIVAAADERLAVAIELACALGLRISDCCALKWNQVDEYIDTEKTNRRMAWHSTDDLQVILARAKTLQSRVGSLNVLCDRRGKPWLDDTLRSHWDKACEAAGVDNAHFHDLRAAAATEVEKRYGKQAAQDFLGHQDGRTTETYLRDKRVNVVTPLARRKA